MGKNTLKQWVYESRDRTQFANTDSANVGEPVRTTVPGQEGKGARDYCDQMGKKLKRSMKSRAIFGLRASEWSF